MYSLWIKHINSFYCRVATIRALLRSGYSRASLRITIFLQNRGQVKIWTAPSKQKAFEPLLAMVRVCFHRTWKPRHLSEQVPLISVWLEYSGRQVYNLVQFNLTGKVMFQMISYLAETLDNSFSLHYCRQIKVTDF